VTDVSVGVLYSAQSLVALANGQRLAHAEFIGTFRTFNRDCPTSNGVVWYC
jgi:hypothetical protein